MTVIKALWHFVHIRRPAVPFLTPGLVPADIQHYVLQISLAIVWSQFVGDIGYSQLGRIARGCNKKYVNPCMNHFWLTSVGWMDGVTHSCQVSPEPAE